MATCYANTASVILKSMLPGNPDVSYLHGGMEFATRLKSDWKNGGKYVASPDAFNRETLIDYGGVCLALESMKQSGGACPASLSFLENKESLRPDVQQRLLVNLGKYFDKVNEFKGRPEKLSGLEKDISLALEKVEIENENLLKRCEQNKSDLQFEVPLNVIIEQEFIASNENEYCGKERKEQIKQNLRPTSHIKREEIRLQIKPELARKFYSSIFSDPFLKEKLLLETGNDPAYASSQAVLGNLLQEKGQREKLTDQLATKIEKLFSDHLLPDDKKCPISADKSSKVKPAKLAEVFVNELQYQRRIPCEKLVKKWQMTDEVKKKEIITCYPAKFNDLLDALAPILEVGAYTKNTLIKKLLDQNSSYGDQLKRFLFPECMEKSNLLPLNNIKCTSYDSCTDNPAKCTDEKKYSELFRSKVFESLKANTAVGFAVCTGFFKDPDLRTDYCQKKAEGIEGHGLHAMTVSGYRCLDNKLEYQIINSWGKGGCPAKKENGYKNSSVTCELDSNGNSTGNFWVKEETLVNNMIGFQVFNKENGK